MNLQDAHGHWALVTGASAGIGRQICHQPAAAGMHLAMVSRRGNLLIEPGEDLAKKHQIRTLPIPLDLHVPDAPAQVKARLGPEDIKIRLLVNNAAFGRWGRFQKTGPDVYTAMVQLNTTALVALCWHFLPDLASHRTSVLINVSSQAAYQPVPFMAVYAATKAFVHHFSQALYWEWKDRGVLVQTLVPGPTETEFDARAGAYASAVGKRDSPADVVQVALAHLGKDKPVVSNKSAFMQRLFAGLAPPRTVLKTVAKMFQPPDEK